MKKMCKNQIRNIIVLIIVVVCMCGCKNDKSNSSNQSKEIENDNIDNNELKKMIDTYGQYNNDNGQYSVSTYELLMKAVNDGLEILKNDNAKQTEIDKAIEDIKKAADELKIDMWTEPLSDFEKEKVIKQCISDYGVFNEDISVISTNLSDWDINIFTDRNNLIVARCNLLDQYGYKLVLAAFTPNNENLIPHFEWINYSYVKGDEQQYIDELIEMGYLADNAMPN